MVTAPLVMGFVLIIAFVVLAVKRGHVQAWTDIFVGSILGVLLLITSVFEILRICLLPLSKTILIRRRLIPPGHGPRKHRRIVIFDGICVLCNRFGAFVHGRLIDTGAVDWVPFQDKDNEHVDIPALVKEFSINEADLQDRICAISGNEILWGADAVIEVCQWCVWPYNLASLGKIVPFAFRDAIYRTVAGERYKWFGTQPLDENFAKYLCPYYYMNKKAFDEKAQKRALEAEKRRKEIAKTMKMAEAEVERKAALSKKGKTE
mmetsp:Transcript_8456/g.11818  ORF Transcript_8456/g.11818 Transcript_8456/m.11818 type:complete len:263 (+) Transcript_8456:285-1073(+)